MNTPTIQEIKGIIGQILGLRDFEVTDRIVEELGAESADVLNILGTIEDRYAIRIKDSEAIRIKSTLDLYQLVLNKLS